MTLSFQMTQGLFHSSQPVFPARNNDTRKSGDHGHMTTQSLQTRGHFLNSLFGTMAKKICTRANSLSGKKKNKNKNKKRFNAHISPTKEFPPAIKFSQFHSGCGGHALLALRNDLGHQHAPHSWPDAVLTHPAWDLPHHGVLPSSALHLST